MSRSPHATRLDSAGQRGAPNVAPSDWAVQDALHYSDLATVDELAGRTSSSDADDIGTLDVAASARTTCSVSKLSPRTPRSHRRRRTTSDATHRPSCIALRPAARVDPTVPLRTGRSRQLDVGRARRPSGDRMPRSDASLGASLDQSSACRAPLRAAAGDRRLPRHRNRPHRRPHRQEAAADAPARASGGRRRSAHELGMRRGRLAGDAVADVPAWRCHRARRRPCSCRDGIGTPSPGCGLGS